MWSVVLDKLTLILILIWYVTGPNFRYKCDRRGVHACELDVLWLAICHQKSSGVGAFTWMSLRWFQSVVVRTKKEFLCCSVFEWGHAQCAPEWRLVISNTTSKVCKGLTLYILYIYIFYILIMLWKIVKSHQNVEVDTIQKKMKKKNQSADLMFALLCFV